MEDALEIYPKINERINSMLRNSEEEKKRILGEVLHEDTLVATLRLHLYAEKELNSIIESVFLHPDSIVKQKFSSKLYLLYNLGYLEKSVLDAVKKLTEVRNGFAHNLEYGKEKDVYFVLKSGLSDSILTNHKLDIEMIELANGQLDDEIKFRILLAHIWIQLRIFSTSILLKKFDFAKRLQNEVVEELITSSLEN